MAIIDDFEGIAKGMKGDLKPPAKPNGPINPEPTCVVCLGTGKVNVPFGYEACRFCEEGLKYTLALPDLHPPDGWSRPLCHDCNGRGADTYGNICRRCIGKGHS